ncbi:MAG TPA: DUF2269 family protein [Gaiellaceae bacterium]
MSTAQWLLMLHVTGAFFLVSGSVTAGVLNVLAGRAERPSETALLLRLIKTVVIVIGVGVVATLVFGIWLWHEQGFGIGTFWIWASIVLWVIANALGGIGGKHQGRARKLAEQLAAAGDTMTDELRALLRDPRGNALSWLAGVATLAILVLMIWRPA